jgi:hypothetical protein
MLVAILLLFSIARLQSASVSCLHVPPHLRGGRLGPCGPGGESLAVCRDTVPHPGKSVAWGQWAIVQGEFGGQGGVDSGEDYAPAPDIDHKNEDVRNCYKDWLRWLQSEIGFESMRFDYVKVLLLSHAECSLCLATTTHSVLLTACSRTAPVRKSEEEAARGLRGHGTDGFLWYLDHGHAWSSIQAHAWLAFLVPSISSSRSHEWCSSMRATAPDRHKIWGSGWFF